MTRNTNLIPRREDVFYPLESHFNKFFDEFFNSPVIRNSVKNSGHFPKMNVYSDNDEVVFTVSVPGVKKEDLDIHTTSNNELIISGKMSDEYQLNDYNVLIHELRMSSFERRVTLPENVVGDPKVTLKDGILTLKWQAKNESKPLNKKISISSA